MESKIRRSRGVGGHKKLRKEREQYLLLVGQGPSNREACKIVGINERTGREWRNGRSDPTRFRPPARTEQAADSSPSRCLREAERIHIADRLREQATIRAIAAELGRSPSTISREISRNRTTSTG
ncbi:helix-turn-helix domain-containing protein, partial [Streptomyces sp. NPDC059956]|uniref:helix-turn-helix domain-containing protein n=1 Tax=Streptomyces sp. NPDC059956 TaxID=3347015 RepID=UPI0036514B47